MNYYSLLNALLVLIKLLPSVMGGGYSLGGGDSGRGGILKNRGLSSPPPGLITARPSWGILTKGLSAGWASLPSKITYSPSKGWYFACTPFNGWVFERKRGGSGGSEAPLVRTIADRPRLIFWEKEEGVWEGRRPHPPAR